MSILNIFLGIVAFLPAFPIIFILLLMALDEILK